MPRKGRRAILVGLGVGALGVVLSLIPFILNLEENAELDWLFSNRGEVAAPSDVVIIGIDKQTAVASTTPVVLLTMIDPSLSATR